MKHQNPGFQHLGTKEEEHEPTGKPKTKAFLIIFLSNSAKNMLYGVVLYDIMIFDGG